MKKSLMAIGAAALAAHAIADVPSTARSEAAIERNAARLERELSEAGLSIGAPIFIQITKVPAKLSVYVEAESGKFELFRSYPVCAYSGGLGPKKRQGDGKSPEGFYRIKPGQMNPASSYHLSFNLGYPNRLDRAKGYTGDFLMVHGNCVSIGCYAMTDPVIEEIWTLMSAAFDGGQRDIQVHIFPYRMNWPMRMVPKNHPDGAFWTTLAPAWTAFSTTHRPPEITVANGQYVVSVANED